MRKSAHKDIFDYLQQVIPGANKGQMYRRVCLMASLVQACIHNGHCRLESLSEATDAYRAQKKSSLLQQARMPDGKPGSGLHTQWPLPIGEPE